MWCMFTPLEMLDAKVMDLLLFPRQTESLFRRLPIFEWEIFRGVVIWKCLKIHMNPEFALFRKVIQFKLTAQPDLGLVPWPNSFIRVIHNVI